MSVDKPEDPWFPISKEERLLHEILFYSQGPVDGYILGEGIRDLLLKSGLSLTYLSQIWNLADISNDNVLSVHEFVIIMHLIRGVLSGRPVPKTLPRPLIPPKTTPQVPPPMSQQEKDAYLRVFQTLDYNRAGFIDVLIAAEMFLATKLAPETLAQIWDLSEFGRDGKLNPEKFAIACHLLRYAKQGGSLDGPVDVFQYAPQHVSPISLLARKRRVSEYEEHKQRLMSLKERRKIQAVREARRLDLLKEKVECLQELFELLKKLSPESDAISNMSTTIMKDKGDNDKQEEIAFRLKKEHEKVRQETVKIILGEQKFNSDISIIKKDTDELNKRLMLVKTHATKDPDPFHQLFEQRKEKRQGSTIKDLDKIDIYIPFEFSPFDLSMKPDSLPSGMAVIGKGNNHTQSVAEVKSVIADLKEFGEEFMDVWGETVSSSNESTKEFEDDEIFREVHDWCEDNWPNLECSLNGLEGMTDPQLDTIKQKLSDIREEITKLNSQGGRLVFRNQEDYHARKKALEEEEKVEKGRVQRRSVTERLRINSTGTHRSREATHIHSSTGERQNIPDRSQAAQAAREYRLKRRSQTFDLTSGSPDSLGNLDRERRLWRSSTDQASVSDECSLSRESSLSSFDQPLSLRGSRRLEEESSTIRTQYSSRTDDSGILTFRSGDRKDDFDLEQCSGSPVSYETTDAHMLSERSEVLTEVKKDDQTESIRLSPEPEEKDKQSTHYNSVNTKIHSSSSPVIARKSSKKHRAPVPPSNTQISTFCDTHSETDIHSHGECKPTRTATELVKPLSLEFSSNKNEIQINSTQTANTTNESVAVQPKSSSYLKDKRPEHNESTHLSRTDDTPKRPPRLKKRLTSESSNEPSTPTICSPTSDLGPAVEESLKSDNQFLDTVPVFESTAVVVEDRKTPKTELLSNNVPDTDIHEHTAIDKELYYLDKEVHRQLSDSHCSADQIVTDIPRNDVAFIIEQQHTEKSDPDIPSLLINSSSNKQFNTGKTTTEVLSEVEGIQQQTLPLIYQEPPVSTAVLSSSEESYEHLPLNTYTSDTMCDDLAQRSPNGIGTSPPPLPSSAPPPLPTNVESKTQDIYVEADEEVVTVEYTLPVSVNPQSPEYILSSELPESDVPTHLNDCYKIALHGSSKESNLESTEVSSTNNKKGRQAIKESPSTSKTTTDLRSDFFGLTPRRSNNDVLETDLLETPTTSYQDPRLNDFKNEITFNKRFDFGTSVCSDISNNDSGGPINVGGDVFSPERQNVLSNNSTESAFEDSRSVSSTSSVKLLHESKSHINDNTPSFTKTIPNTPIQDHETYSHVSSFAHKPNSSVSVHTGKTSSTSASSAIQKLSSDNSLSASDKQKTHVTSSDQDVRPQTKQLTNVTQPKHSVIAKKKVGNRTSDVGKLSELEMERQEVILQSMVTRKVNLTLSPTLEPEDAFQEAVQGVGKSLRSSNPSEYGFVYSAERPKPPPEAGWSEKQTGDQKINLYSENVLKDGNTTDSIDRESIANLSTTKKQWENIFTSHSLVDTSIKKKASPKWEVRLPYTEKHSASSTNQDYPQTEDDSTFSKSEVDQNTNMFKKPVVTESAIEREIRLAFEREDMLRKEKEERQKLIEKQKSQTFIASYATSNAESDSNHPAYNELAEADRNPDLWRVEHEDRRTEQEEDENDSEQTHLNESIIEREIRLQREREAEIVKMRTLAQQLHPQPHPQKQHKPSPTSPPQHHQTQNEGREDINHNQMKSASYDDPVPSSSNEVENRIVRELRELKEREEEIRKLHNSLQRTHIIDEIDGLEDTSLHDQKTSFTPTDTHGYTQSGQTNWQRDVSAFLTPQQRRESVDSTSSHSTGRSPSDIIPTRRDVKVRPLADSYSDDEDQKPNYFQKQETPIEREMRLARERENDLRKQKGLPEIDNNEENIYSSYSPDQDSNNSTSVSRPRSLAQPGYSMKKFATSRLQQELQEQKDRELALLNEGKIITTSEQHISPLSFMEISGGEKNDGTVKRNFVTRKPTSNDESYAYSEQQEITSPSGQTARKNAAVGTGGQLFSYREFKQSAESKIERELREMKEREEELRKQRTGATTETSH